jgi:hypothetical protein
VEKNLNELEHLIELEELVEMKVTWFYNFFLLLSQSDKPHATANKKTLVQLLHLQRDRKILSFLCRWITVTTRVQI